MNYVVRFTASATLAFACATVGVGQSREADTSSDLGSEWVVTGAIPSQLDLLQRALFFVSTNPGADADDVAQELGISLLEAIGITDDLLVRGLIDFD